MHEDGAVVLALQWMQPTVQTARTLIEQHLTHFQRHGVQVAVMVFDLDGPRLVVVVVFMSNVNNGGDDMRFDLKYNQQAVQ